MNNNLLIVESFNDKFFLEALIKHLSKNEIDVSPPICSTNDYECLEGLSQEKLSRKLDELKSNLEKHPREKLGIIIDADSQGIDKRIELMNTTLSILCTDVTLSEPNKLFKSNQLGMEIGCHVMNIDGHGELETVLKTIKNKESIYADCLEKWKECLTKNKKTISDKNFDKFWLNVYQRYDGCTKSEKKQAGKKCSFEASMDKADLWDFGHPVLDDLKKFLSLF